MFAELVKKKIELEADRSRILGKHMTAAKEATIGHNREIKQIDMQINKAVSAAIATKRAQKEYGIVSTNFEGVEIKHDVPRKVKWDQAQLRQVRSKIAESGDNPDDYIETGYTVSERKYQSWPEIIRRQFESARTEMPGKAAIKGLKILGE